MVPPEADGYGLLVHSLKLWRVSNPKYSFFRIDLTTYWRYSSEKEDYTGFAAQPGIALR